MVDLLLQKHGTKTCGLSANNIIQAAQADLRLKKRKEDNDADAGEPYSFSRKHVKRSKSVGELIALAYYNPDVAATTDKKSTYIVYADRDVLRLALLACLSEDAS